ncbi:hypothetical protein BDK51DRAFT_33922, partial [Blyttiomyces helicus]
ESGRATEPGARGRSSEPPSRDADDDDDQSPHEEAGALLPGSQTPPIPRRSSSTSGPKRASAIDEDEDDDDFDFGPILAIPLSSTLNKPDTELAKNVNLWSGLALIVGMCIGSGIFASPGPVYRFTGSVGAALGVWLVAGLLAIAGGLCYAELGTMCQAQDADNEQ